MEGRTGEGSCLTGATATKALDTRLGPSSTAVPKANGAGSWPVGLLTVTSAGAPDPLRPAPGKDDPTACTFVGYCSGPALVEAEQSWPVREALEAGL